MKTIKKELTFLLCQQEKQSPKGIKDFANLPMSAKSGIFAGGIEEITCR